MVRTVIDKFKNTPNGKIKDSDTILADIVNEADMEITGLSMEILETWQNSHDKESVEKLFESLTGTSFEDYLTRCIDETTR